MYLVYLKYWTLHLMPLVIYPEVLFWHQSVVFLQTVIASAAGKQRMPASFSLDCWSLGAIAYGIFLG